MISATPIISELQNQKFTTFAKEYIDGVDLNYQGSSSEAGSYPFIMRGTDTMRNKVLFWLSSVKGDYVRESSKGGILYSLLGSTMTEEAALRTKSAITAFFAAHFQQDLQLLEVSVVADKPTRRWIVTLYVQDPIRRELFTAAVGVSI